MRDSIILKWGTIKNWSGLKSEKALSALKCYNEDKTKYNLINVIKSMSRNPTFILDFEDRSVTRSEAIDYIEAGEGITAGSGIKAGEGIEASESIDYISNYGER